MPLALDYDSTFDRSSKRRRLVDVIKMARRANTIEEIHPHDQACLDDKTLGAGCEVPTDMGRSHALPRAEFLTSDRDELIQCIKRGQRPMWVPKAGLQALRAEEEALQGRGNAPADDGASVSPKNTSFQFEHDILFGPWISTNEHPERPDSNLRHGFIGDEKSRNTIGAPSQARGTDFLTEHAGYSMSDSSSSWLESPSDSSIGQALSGTRLQQTMTPIRPNRSRAPSLSSSFIMRVPTSPLVNAVNNPNLDFSPKSDVSEISENSMRTRRRTLPPSSFQSLSPLSMDASTPNFSRPLSHTPRREPSFSYQSHQPRRSIGSFTFQSSPGLANTKPQGRRISLAPDGSPKRRTSMVGSFEESILRGRMSSPASKPFDFIAQIGVMGKGDCPSSLKCPAHVSVPFEAVFYSYPSSQNSRSIADDAPSPYVGTVNVEQNLKPIQLVTKQKRGSALPLDMERHALLASSDPTAPENTSIGKALAREARLQQQQQSSESNSRINIGGAYRVPQQGQLQIIIKTSNKTAVKLFLVPYDLQGMEPGTKTFIRQKSYSCGPIVEGALSETSQKPNILDPLKDKNILRYLIHIQFCCPSKGKFYLYDNIRVVFANRVPDGKEKLRNEVQLPEPRYSPWKPLSNSSRTARSSVDGFTPGAHTPTRSPSSGLLTGFQSIEFQEPRSGPEQTSVDVEPRLPFHPAEASRRSFNTPLITSRPSKDGFVFPVLAGSDDPSHEPEPNTLSPRLGFLASTSPRPSPVPWGSGSGSGSSSTTRSFSPGPVEAGTGLLSRQLRELYKMSTNYGIENPSDPWGASATLGRVLSAPKETSREKDDNAIT